MYIFIKLFDNLTVAFNQFNAFFRNKSVNFLNSTFNDPQVLNGDVYKT